MRARTALNRHDVWKKSVESIYIEGKDVEVKKKGRARARVGRTSGLGGESKGGSAQPRGSGTRLPSTSSSLYLLVCSHDAQSRQFDWRCSSTLLLEDTTRHSVWHRIELRPAMVIVQIWTLSPRLVSLLICVVVVVLVHHIDIRLIVHTAAPRHCKPKRSDIAEKKADDQG